LGPEGQEPRINNALERHCSPIFEEEITNKFQLEKIKGRHVNILI